MWVDNGAQMTFEMTHSDEKTHKTTKAFKIMKFENINGR